MNFSFPDKTYGDSGPTRIKAVCQNVTVDEKGFIRRASGLARLLEI